MLGEHSAKKKINLLPCTMNTKNTTMAVPPLKRRKLEHSSSDEESEDGVGMEVDDGTDSEEEESKEVEDAKSNRKNLPTKKASQVEYEAMYAGGLYKSSMFKLQIDEMLAEERPNYEKLSSAIEGALTKVKAVIEAIPDREPLSVSPLRTRCQREKILTQLSRFQILQNS